MEVELAEQGLDAAPLIGREVLGAEPAAADTGEQIGVRARRGQVSGQDRVDLVLHAGALLHEMGAAHHQAAQRPGPIIRDPRAGQESAARSCARIRASTLSV